MAHRASKGPESLFRAAGALKTVKRKGWLKAGIEDRESVADHSFRMAVIGAYLSAGMNLDSAKTIRMCLIHDLAESKIGDLIPEEKTSEGAHRKSEDVAMRQITRTLPARERKLVEQEWNELLSNKTNEARLVWQIDKLEMGLTMKDYIRAGFDSKKMKQFDPSVYVSEDLKALLDEY